VLTAATRRQLQARQAEHAAVKDAFYLATQTRRSELFESLQRARDGLCDQLFAGPEGPVEPAAVPAGVRSYAARADWSLLDMVALATRTTAGPAELAAAVAPRALAYQALRMLDDVLDDHVDYKGGKPTLLGEFRADPALAPLAAAANLLPVAMILAGTELTAEDRALLQRTLRGMLLEYAPGPWTPELYQRMAYAKMVSYGQFLYRPVTDLFPEPVRARLEPFLATSFYLAQLLNDLHDVADDLRRGQPNYWTLPDSGPDRLGAFLAELERLSDDCGTLDPMVQPYGHARLADLLGYLFQVDGSG